MFHKYGRTKRKTEDDEDDEAENNNMLKKRSTKNPLKTQTQLKSNKIYLGFLHITNIT